VDRVNKGEDEASRALGRQGNVKCKKNETPVKKRIVKDIDSQEMKERNKGGFLKVFLPKREMEQGKRGTARRSSKSQKQVSEVETIQGGRRGWDHKGGRNHRSDPPGDGKRV